MNARFVGIDLAKSIFQVHAVDETGQPVVRKAVSRAKLLGLVRQFEPCVIGMEACSSAYFWARRWAEMGHEVRLMPPAYMKPYVKTNKHDAADAEAICEAVQRPNMRFVPIKTPEQQAVMLLHRARSGFVKARTACANQIRAILAEFGLTLPVGIQHVTDHSQGLIEDASNELPDMCRRLVAALLEHLRELSMRTADIERQLASWHRDNEDSQRIAQVPGIGLISATALAASIGNATQFRNGRHLSAWLALVQSGG